MATQRLKIAGDVPVGIAPVRADSTCSWGVLDVDWYNMRAVPVARSATCSTRGGRENSDQCLRWID